MRESLRDIVRRVLSGSILVTGAATPAAAAVVADHPMVELPPPAAELSAASDVGVMVLREARPRLVLKRAAESTLTLVSSHRSHRSHSSHRSHYSSSGGGGGGGYPRSTPRTTTPTRRSEPLPVTGAYCLPVDVEFGSRLLQRGMCGSDVAELMRLLVAHGHLASYDVNSDSLFTYAVENAVREFQRSRQLDQDGKVGRVTSRHLRREP